MTVSGDYYGILGVPRDADTKAIKSAFRQLAHRCHPDVSTEPDAEQRFREIAEAYGVLSDPAKRARYDEQGSAGLAGASAEDLWGGIDFTDIFGSQAASFGNLFEQLFGWSPSDSRPWGDVRQDLTISLEEVMTGVDRVVAVRRPGPCPQCAGSGSRPGTIPLRCQHCDGTGRRTMASRQGSFLIGQVTTVCPECAGRGRIVVDPCPVCRARGWATRTEKITIRIPPGIPDGATLKLAGTGRPNTTPDQPTSDVYLSIHARTDPLFERVGADLWHDLHIHAADACGSSSTRRERQGPSAARNPTRHRAAGGGQGPAALRPGWPRQPSAQGHRRHPSPARAAPTPALRTASGSGSRFHGGWIREHGR
jgi:molecular chaperone DnaJ